ncbi:MAG: hypothetical protein K9L66_02655 [Spirochaetaceae bacterium]|nr:hypothetical protein [Spirochaetaceae bacterium]MCF7947325.1 hypothetical protein [Spirochaetia bacterium]MCF7950551.1 hypothetical protein [Spirochaetaceae bacterium]
MNKSEKAHKGNANGFTGAWMTDIDDTIIHSGITPDTDWIKWISKNIEILQQHKVLWVPMSGVAMVKLGPRILYRLPSELLPGVLYYGGDGSQKYYYNSEKKVWAEDEQFRRVFTDAQALAIIGREEFQRGILKDDNPVAERYKRAKAVLLKAGFESEGILCEMKPILQDFGFDPELSETYFRGGSVSWMMLGDISAEPYKESIAMGARKTLIEYAKKRLSEEGYLMRFGDIGVQIPFPGARGIKFVLVGNDKERGTRDLINREQIPSHNILFSGNELFHGGNDNMIRNIKGVTLLSVGDKTDPGEAVISGKIGVGAFRQWMESICNDLERGETWSEILLKYRSLY